MKFEFWKVKQWTLSIKWIFCNLNPKTKWSNSFDTLFCLSLLLIEFHLLKSSCFLTTKNATIFCIAMDYNNKSCEKIESVSLFISELEKTSQVVGWSLNICLSTNLILNDLFKSVII